MRLKTYFLFFLIWAFGASCKKVVSIVQPGTDASLTIVNAVDGSSSLLTTFWPDSAVASFYSTAPAVSYESSHEYGLLSGERTLIIFQESDTSAPLLNTSLELQGDSLYSLFLSGAFNVQNTPDTLLVVDHPPYHSVGDSTVGIRFVNVSPSAGVISVDIKGNNPGSEVGSLPYQGVSGFNIYPANSSVPSPSIGYVFEFRSAATDSLLSTYTYRASSLPRFKNVSLVLAGTISGSGIRVFEVNNY